ncbi:MAG: multidrug efflux SMR transporter [Deltaproteobacteria bacterium]|nr:multidrug efflux SMR transporter [Deltaproteobacteria bacterium]
MRWFLVAFAIFFEVAGTICMKLSNGFTNVCASVLVFVFWAISFSMFILALRHFDLSFIYAVWAGVGISLIAVIGMVFLGEHISILKIVAIIIIATGVILLNISEGIAS